MHIYTYITAVNNSETSQWQKKKHHRSLVKKNVYTYIHTYKSIYIYIYTYAYIFT